MNNNVTQLHNTTPDELERKIVTSLEKVLDQFSDKFQPKEPSQYITRKQVKEMLSVSYVTIHDWNNKNILKPYKIGGRTLYKRQEIEDVLNKSAE